HAFFGSPHICLLVIAPLLKQPYLLRAAEVVVAHNVGRSLILSVIGQCSTPARWCSIVISSRLQIVQVGPWLPSVSANRPLRDKPQCHRHDCPNQICIQISSSWGVCTSSP